MTYTYKSLEEAISCTQTQQSFNWKEVAAKITGAILCALVLGLFVGILFVVVSNIVSEPPQTKFSIVEASILQFNLTGNNTLYYNFKVTIAAKNFHTNIESYDKVTAIASYEGNQLASVEMAHFKLIGKNIVVLEPIVFEGNTMMIFEPQQLANYNKETQLNIYNLDLELDMYYVTNIRCPGLRVPLISNSKVAPTFNVTTCSYVHG